MTQPPSILIVNSHIPWGGLGQFTLSLAKGLRDYGYTVMGLVTHSDEDNYENFRSINHTTAYFGHIPKLLRYLAIWWYILRQQPDIIIINYNAVIHFLLPFIPKCIVIDIIHNDVDDFYRISGINEKHIDAWVAPTPGIKEGFIRYSPFERAESDTRVISHGISESLHAHFSDSSAFVITFVGAVYEHKGADILPDIFEKVTLALPHARLQIIGKGKLSHTLKENFHAKGLADKVQFLGVIPHEQVREMLASSDVLLFPTRVEAFGLVIAEAMMEGAIPVVTLLPGITDATVTDGESGYLIPKDDIATFANKCILLGNDPILKKTLSTQAIDRAKTVLSLLTMSRRYDALIKELL
ncbi:MAG: glycosyltransferase family 4 protein [Sulfuricurvum sp.]|uniref:glycosyltransferase family 4 protein n=1 Tax=Sulfuricurvum sp. TaxID=2025608 RepID=UPI00356B546C